MDLMPNSDSAKLADFCQAYPFLEELPPELLHSIDTTTYHLPDDATEKKLVELEARLNCHIMIYRAVPLASRGNERQHLCRLLVPACLDPEQLEELQRSEGACREDGAVFVAYMRPLQLRTQAEKTPS